MNEKLDTQDTEEELLYFVRIYRDLIDDYHLRKRLTLDEFFILIWLSFRANPYNGIFNTSYAAISAELSGRYTVNKINKICLSLKKKRYVYFQSQQGCRSSFGIEIDKFPLPNKRFREIYKDDTQRKSRSSDRSIDSPDSEAEPELRSTTQKSGMCNHSYNTRSVMNPDTANCRSANKDKENNKEKLANRRKRNFEIIEFQSQSADEDVCKEIATELEETNLEILITTLEDFGIECIVETFNYVNSILESENGVNNPKAFFYSNLKKVVKRDYS